MGKLSFIAGLAAGYVLGARAGRQRYEQIARTSGKVWNSDPVQKQVERGKEVARTKAAPVVADLVADAARATGEKLRQGRTVASEAVSSASGDSDEPTANGTTPAGTPTPVGGDSDGPTVQDHTEAWSATTRPTSSSD
jgi:hypothetical protein